MTTLRTTIPPTPNQPTTRQATATAQVQCGSCDLDFGVRPQAEADYFAGVHNDLQHGGRPDAQSYDVEAASHTGDVRNQVDDATGGTAADDDHPDQSDRRVGDLYDGYDTGPHPAHAVPADELADEDLDGLW